MTTQSVYIDVEPHPGGGGYIVSGLHYRSEDDDNPQSVNNTETRTKAAAVQAARRTAASYRRNGVRAFVQVSSGRCAR